MEATQFVGPPDDPDRFVLRRQVASGGEGVVWRAVQHLDDGGQIDVAVKQLRVGLTVAGDDPVEVGRRWRNTAIRLRELRSPGLVAVHTAFLGQTPHPAGVADGPAVTPYFVMAWVEGTSLDEWAATRPRWLDRLGSLHDLAAGLDELHQAGLVHGDIKPRNILVASRQLPTGERSDRALAVDFGLLRVVSQTPPGASPTSAYSPGFSAPETFGGLYSSSSDLYAFAGVMYFLIADEPPPAPPVPDDETDGLVGMSEIMRRLAESESEADASSVVAHCRQRLLARGLPAEAVDVLTSGLATDPEDRPRGGAARLLQTFTEALVGAMQGATLAAEDVGPDDGLPPGVSAPPPVYVAASQPGPTASVAQTGTVAHDAGGTDSDPGTTDPERKAPVAPEQADTVPDELDPAGEHQGQGDQGYLPAPEPPPVPRHSSRRWTVMVVAVAVVVLALGLFLNSRDRGQGPSALRPGEKPPTTPAAAPPPPEATPAPGSTVAPGPALPPEPTTTTSPSPSAPPVPRTVGPQGEVPLPRTPYSSLARRPQAKSDLDAFNIPWIAAPQLVDGQVHPDALAFKPFFCNQRQGRAFLLGGEFVRFDGLVGMADDSSPTDIWDFRILADGRSVHSGTIRHGEPALVLDLDVRGVDRLEFGFLARPNCGGGSTLVLGSGQLRTERQVPPSEQPPTSR